MTGERRHEKKRSALKVALVVNLVVFGVLALGLGREYLRNREIEQEIARMEAENARLEVTRLQALELIEDLSSTYYLEGEARTKRGMGKDGETLIVVQSDDEEAQRAADDTPATTGDGITNPVRWFYYFFDRPKFESLRDV